MTRVRCSAWRWYFSPSSRVVLAATLTAAATNLHATQTLTQQRDERYAAEAGILAAAGRIQSRPDASTRHRSAIDRTTVASIRGPDFVVNSMQVDVSCTPGTGSGAGPGAVNRPPYSVLALPSSGAWQQRGHHSSQRPEPERVRTSRIRTVTCLRSSSVRPTPNVDPGRRGTAPGYGPRCASAPAVAPPPSACNAGVATFSPGTYNAPPSEQLRHLVVPTGRVLLRLHQQRIRMCGPSTATPRSSAAPRT